MKSQKSIPSPADPSVDGLAQKSLGLHLAHQAAMVRDNLQVLDRDNRVVEAAWKNTLDNFSSGENAEMPGDIILGNQTVTQPQPPATNKGLPWGQLAMAAGLMATGVGMPAGAAILAPAIGKMLAPTVATAAQQILTSPGDSETLSVDMLVEPPK